MSVFKRFSATDRMILGGSLVVLLLLSYLLYDDSILFPTPVSNEPSIGTIVSSNNDVRRKNNENFVWLPSNQKDQVHNNDSIFTGDNSHAEIRMNDGSIIQIQANSMVNLNQKNGQMELDLRFGQFKGNGNTPLRIKTGDEEYTIQGTDANFEINRSRSGALDVKVLSGSAEIVSKAGRQKLKSNESLQISQKGVEKTQADASIRLTTKNDVSLFRAEDKMPLQFTWEGKGPISRYDIEISKTETFKKILSLRSTQEQNIAITDSLKEGTYFWRVKGLDIRQKLLTTSNIHKFYLSYLPAPEIQTPENNETLLATTLATAEGVLQAATQISWAGDERHVTYKWQLSGSEEFTNILAEKPVKTTQITTPPLRSGTYFARVMAYNKDKQPSPWSKVHRFEFQVNNEAKPPAPTLVKKNIRFQLPKPDDRSPSSTQSPPMAWNPVRVAKNYRWEIANNPRFNNAQTLETTDTKVVWDKVQPGTHYFRVFTLTALGQSSDPSETGVLVVYGDAPILGPIPMVLVKETNIHAQPPAKETLAQWSPVAHAKKYLLQVDTHQNFSSPTQQEISGHRGVVPLPQPGKYFVRVKALDESGQEISEFSNIQGADYFFKKTLPNPELLEPNDNTTVFLQKDMEPLVWLEWKNVPDSVNYVLEVSARPDFSRLVLSKTLNETRFLIREKIPYGNIYWRVRALGIDESLHSDWSQRKFMILHQKNSGF